MSCGFSLSAVFLSINPAAFSEQGGTEKQQAQQGASDGPLECVLLGIHTDTWAQ